MTAIPVTGVTQRDLSRNRRNAAQARLVTDDTRLRMVSSPICARTCARGTNARFVQSWAAFRNRVPSVTRKHWRGFRGFPSVTHSVTPVTGQEQIGEVEVREKSKPMRQAMPTVAAWIDDLRSAFGSEMIDAQIRAAVRDGAPTFFASEAGHQLGTPATLGNPARSVSVGVQQLAKGSRRPE